MAENWTRYRLGSAPELTAAQHEAVHQEVRRILAHPAFKGSRRSIDLFRCMIDHALAGNEEEVKERTLGIEVFGRSPDYDTNEDPIVRRTANEIRKRLAQYYQETKGPLAVKIELIRGSYVPEFQFETEHSQLQPVAANGLEAGLEPGRDSIPKIAAPPGRTSRKWLLIFAAVMVATAAIVLFIRFNNSWRSPQYRIWMPLVQAGQPINMCLSDLTAIAGAGQSVSQPTASPVSPQPVPAGTLKRYSSDTPFTDAHVAEEVSTLIAGYGGRTTLQPCSALSFGQLRQRPTVLIGGTNNPWALDLLAPLRYSIRVDSATNDKWIQDSQHPEKRDWRIDGKLSNTDTSPDYAVISRFFYKDSGQWVVAISGLEAHGTEAAGELVADPAFVKYLPAGIGANSNFQIVLRVTVLRGSTGPFEVLSVHSW